MTPVTGTVYSSHPSIPRPLPDFLREIVDRVEDASASVLVHSPVRKTIKPFVCSPSIHASPDAPKAPHPYHSAEDLLVLPGVMRDARKLKNKNEHTIAITDSAKKHGRLLADPVVAREVSLRSKHKLFHPSDEIPPFEAAPGTLVSIPSHDTVEVQDVGTKRKRTFGLHRSPAGKSIYPKDGDGLIKAKQGTALSPNKFLAIAKKYKAAPKGNPSEFLVAEVAKILAPSKSSSPEL